MQQATKANWYVIIVDPNRQHVVVDKLEQQGFTAYMPMLWRRQRGARGRLVEIRRAMFACYAFVSLVRGQEDWPAVEATQGVWRFLTIEKRPAILADDAIEAIRAKESEQNRLYEARKGAVVPPDIQVGHSISIAVGRFAEMISKVENFDEKGRVTVMLQMLGRQNVVKVRQAKLSAA